MRAIMISIKPKWVAKILNGEKTIEIRKTCPAIFKHLHSYEGASLDVYIYCTKEESLIYTDGTDWKGDYVYYKYYADYKGMEDDIGSGKVVAKFTLNKVNEIRKTQTDNWFIEIQKGIVNVVVGGLPKILEKSCLKEEELINYLKGNNGYAWHIDNLVIFDRPKELSEFIVCTEKNHECNKPTPYPCRKCVYMNELSKAPKSWCYCEVE